MHVGCIGQPVDIISGNWKVDGEIGGTGVPRRTVQIGIGVLVAEGGTERVLPPSAPHHEYPHDFCAFLNASLAFSAARLAASATWLASSRASLA